MCDPFHCEKQRGCEQAKSPASHLRVCFCQCSLLQYPACFAGPHRLLILSLLLLLPPAAVIIACNMSGQAQEALRIYERMLAAGAQPTATTYTALISAYGKNGQLEKALQIFQVGGRLVGVGVGGCVCWTFEWCDARPPWAPSRLSCSP
jgi:pentatricopeptide repeat protein